MDSSLDCDSGVSRRNFIKLGVAAAGTGVVASHIAVSHAQTTTSNGGYNTTPWMDPLPVNRPLAPLAALTPAPAGDCDEANGECGRLHHQRWEEFQPKKFYEINVVQAEHQFHAQGPKSVIWGYNGTLPGSTIVARYGEPVCVRFQNNLPANAVGYGSPEISTHLHNLHCGSESDGFTGDYFSPTKAGPSLTAPGRWRDHLYPNMYAGGDPREALGTLWFHDHRMDFTSGNVYRGLAGFYLLFDHIDSGNETDTSPTALRLPSGVGDFDIPLMVQDRQFDAGGNLKLDQFNNDGILGNKICVNGKIQPFFDVRRRKYRFRILNASPSRQYEFYIMYKGRAQNFTYIANDGNLLPAPLTMQKIRIAPAERADIIIDFKAFGNVGADDEVFLVNRLEQVDGRKPTGKLLTPGDEILKFNVKAGAVDDPSRVPATLRELPPIDTKKAVRRRNFEFDRSGGSWTVNGKLFDVTKPLFTVKKGTAEIWTLESKGSWLHPVHIHLEEGRILSRDGKSPPAHERGRKDVYPIIDGEEVEVFIQFRDFTGKYMMHCHNIAHEDHAMMVRFDVVD